MMHALCNLFSMKQMVFKVQPPTVSEFSLFIIYSDFHLKSEVITKETSNYGIGAVLTWMHGDTEKPLQ